MNTLELWAELEQEALEDREEGVDLDTEMGEEEEELPE